MRHALAPGYGDPDNFDIADCSTQRNLDATGRKQSQDLGQLFRSSELTIDAILSSRWCRCQDTAIEMDIGDYRTHDGLNSFFQDHVDRDETLALLREELSRLKSDDLVLMITHQVVIQAVTGISPVLQVPLQQNRAIGAILTVYGAYLAESNQYLANVYLIYVASFL